MIPMIKRSVSLVDERQPETVQLVVTAIGTDRPGIVRQLSERAQGFGANWSGSRMANLAGQFAGIVHFEVPADRADALADALRGLEASGLRIVIAKSVVPPAAAGRRVVMLELVGPDRPGIMRELSRSLADRGVSIEELHTEIVSSDAVGHTFKARALLMVPQSLANQDLQRALEPLATTMTLDIDADDARAAT